MSGTEGLDITGLSKRFGATHAVDGVSLAARPGELVALLGPSGSGKSTIFRCVTQLAKADAGVVRIDGRTITGLKGANLRQARRDIGLIFQQFNLIGRMSALDNVLLGRIGRVSTWRVITRRFPAEDRQLALSA
ncbi:MAG: ATP-binding cassette domain-containing protein, partial [Beijerinckiaceae bacterium]